MENATQALLIAAGVLIGLMILSLVMIGYNEISDYYTAKENAKKVQQLAEFNEEYARYNRDDVRGSELLSLINKIVDFNTLRGDEGEITITIHMNTMDTITNIYYGGSTPKKNAEKLIDITKTYNERNISSIVQEANRIEAKYPQGKAKKLAENLFTLMKKDSTNLDANVETAEEARKKLFNQLKITYDKNELETYQTDILKYYQYMQFKRAHFYCYELKYTSTGRVQSFTFEFNGNYE